MRSTKHHVIESSLAKGGYTHYRFWNQEVSTVINAFLSVIALTKFDISSEPPMFVHLQGAMSDFGVGITPVVGVVVINPGTHLRQLMGVITPFITCSYYLVILVILSLWPFRYRSQQQSDSAVSVEHSKTQGLNKCKCRRSNHFKLTLTEAYSLEI